MKKFFTSDHHFGHSNIIKYSKRPFADVTEMNEQLIKNWNSKITQDDTVYHLGDFAFRNATAAQNIFDRLNGKKHFIIGNHDKEGVNIKGWESQQYYKEITVEGQFIILCHYAMRVWNKSHHGSWQLYGHSHGSLPDDPNALSIDVGVDCHNYMPLSMDEIRRIMKKKIFKPIDHHGRE